MKKLAFVVLALVLCLMLICVVPKPVQAQGEVWTVKADPTFIFSGDSFNVTVTGQAVAYIIMNVKSPNGTIAQDLSGLTNELGAIEFTVGIPLESASGFYKLEVVVQGIVMANATVEVVKNDINWLYNLHLADQAEIDRLNKIVYPLRTKVTQLQDDLADQWVYIIVTLVYAAIVTLVMLFMFKPWMEWRTLRNPGNGSMVRSAKSALHPEPECEFVHLDGVTAQRTILLDKQLVGGDMRTYLVKATPQGEPREVDEVEEIKVTEPKVIIPAAKGSFELKDADVKQTRRSLFGGKRKVKRVRMRELAPEPVKAPAPAPSPPRPIHQREARKATPTLTLEDEFMEWKRQKAKQELEAVHAAQEREEDPTIGEPEPTAWDEPDVVDRMLAEMDTKAPIRGKGAKPLPSLYAKAREQVKNGRKGAVG